MLLAYVGRNVCPHILVHNVLSAVVDPWDQLSCCS
jgi:hypothetical protein